MVHGRRRRRRHAPHRARQRRCGRRSTFTTRRIRRRRWWSCCGRRATRRAMPRSRARPCTSSTRISRSAASARCGGRVGCGGAAALHDVPRRRRSPSLALVLSLVGLYAVVSYSVAERTHELGVRLALGATPASLLAAGARRRPASSSSPASSSAWRARSCWRGSSRRSCSASTRTISGPSCDCAAPARGGRRRGLPDPGPARDARQPDDRPARRVTSAASFPDP